MPRPTLVGPFPVGVDPEAYDQRRRRVFWAMPSGIYLLGARVGSERNLMTTTWVTQLASTPKLLGVAVERDAFTHGLIERSGAYALSIVDRRDRALVRKFVKPADQSQPPTTMAGVPVEAAGGTGSPTLAGAIGVLDCSVTSAVPLGSHTLFIGEVVWVHLAEDAEARVALRMEDTRMNYGG